MNWIDYRKALGIGFDDNSKLEMLKNRIQVFTQKLTSKEYGWEDYHRYITMVCEQLDFYEEDDDIEEMIRFSLQESFQKAESINEVIAKYVAFYNTYNTHDDSRLTKFHESILASFEDTLLYLKIPYEIIDDSDGAFIFPKGAKELDNALVSEPLEWLRDYPITRAIWIKALKYYSEAAEDNASDIADKFRKTLETFFQEFFDGQKSLENYKADYGNYLKTKGVPKEIGANFQTVLQAYTNYINSYAKHRDATSDKVLEYIMYQTGNIIRLLITLEQEEAIDAD